ncbi:MAG: FHA domain-containing protein [Candidatus Binatus sp.]
MLRAQAARLLAVDREAAGTRLLLLKRDEAVVGSAEGSPLHLPDPSVRDRHAIIRYARGRYYVVDLRSSEGTFVNGRRIRRRRALKHGDILRFGGAAPYRFIDPDALKRRRWRRIRRASAVIAILVAIGLADHFEKWGLFSAATITQIAGWVDSHVTPKRVEAPIAKVANAPAAAASMARATSTPAPPIYAATVPAPPPTVPMTEATKTASLSPRPRRTARPSHRATPSSAASVTAPAAAPASLPAAEEVPGTASTSSNWLTVLNGYRARLKVPPVGEDPALSRGCLAHAKYLMTNYGKMMAHGGSPGALFHQEDESKPGYSPEGLKAAQASDVVYQPRNKMTQDQLMEQAIEWWISGPFHRPELLSPELKQVGFGRYCEGVGCVSALNTVSDSALALPGGSPLAEPIEVPPDGATVKAPRFGGEWPDPVSSCPGYSAFAPAITLQLGLHVPAKITDASLTQTTGAAAGTKVDTCAYDSDGYTNPDRGAQARGREVLKSFGEVVMMVRDPLASGETYRVAMTVNGKPYTWSFTAAH